MKTLRYLFPAFLAVLLNFNLYAQSEKIQVIPKPAKIKEIKGTFRVDASTSILMAGKNEDIVRNTLFLCETLRQAGGPVLSPVEMNSKNKKKQAIILSLNDQGKIPAEGYILKVTPKHIFIQGGSGAGLFYGIQTLLQLMPPEIMSSNKLKPGISWDIPCAEIQDSPRFPYRGMHLDVSRHFFGKEFIKRYLDLMATYKMNTFHWHLTDDNGWRIEIKKYPRLTQISAWRADHENLPWRERPAQKEGEKATYGGYYSQDDIREIVQYAKDRYITIIPEIEMPAHSIEVLAAYPQFSCTGGPFTVPTGSYWPNIDILCAGNDSVFTFIDDVLTEVANLFPSKYIHIGGDEADKTRWIACPKCQKRVKDEGLKNEKELQSYFIKRVEKIVISKGKKMIGWDEILEGGLAPEATVMSWRGIEGGIIAARQGHDVIMTPTSYCYFDYCQGESGYEPTSIGGYLPLKKVYSYEPLPQELSSAEQKHILGAQANIWTEYIPIPSHVEYMAIPRMLALSEVVW
ncbi:MAG: beta-N-acetylhexosaminidase, partial [Bacteroidota bacterium]|nr:beta-N-acetylhexosaminidase [Bacteroidota bacterium]